MATQETLERIYRLREFAKSAAQKQANLILRGASRILPAAAKTVAPAAAKVPWSMRSKLLAGAGGVAGAYGTGLGLYHGAGILKPTSQTQQFDTYSQHMKSLQDAYANDIKAVESGSFNPLTGRRDTDMYSFLFGHQTLSATERARQAALMQERLAAARSGKGTLGDYNNRGYFSSNYDQARERALAAANAGVNEGSRSPGLFGRLMLGDNHVVSDDAAKSMQKFIDKYGPQQANAVPGGQFAYIGQRPAGPVDFSGLAQVPGFGHDYSGYYQPYPLAPR